MQWTYSRSKSVHSESYLHNDRHCGMSTWATAGGHLYILRYSYTNDTVHCTQLELGTEIICIMSMHNTGYQLAKASILQCPVQMESTYINLST